MVTHFIFPSHPLRPTKVDELFADQFLAFEAAGYPVSLCSEEVIQNNKPLRNISPGAIVVYRGWMLNARDYGCLSQAVANASATMLTSADAYLLAHHLPRWYPLLQNFTPETRVLSLDADWEHELRSIGWETFFVKDFVKSLKTARGSIVRDPSEIGALVDAMKHVRGEIEGGLCVRRVEPFIAESERRYFVLDQKVFSPDGNPTPDIVREVALQIPSPFYSIDVIRRTDGALRVVEIGDGQVSDLVGWSVSAFVNMWTAVRPDV